MTIIEIQEMPTTIEVGHEKYHESVLRSYQILQKTKYLLKQAVHTEVILELIKEMEIKTTP